MELKTIAVEAKPRVLTASWSVEEMMKLQSSQTKGVRHLKPYYTGKRQTVKRRNKARWHNKLAQLHNRRVANWLATKRVETRIAQQIATEIRREIDNDIISHLLSSLSEHSDLYTKLKD